MNFKKLISVLVAFATVLASLAWLLPSEVQADDLPSLMNVEIVGDVLYWDAFDGAGQYIYNIKNGGGYIAPLVDEDGKVLKRQSLNLKEACESFNFPGGTFTVQLCAHSDFGWKGGKAITSMWKGEYTHVTDKQQLAKPTNEVLNDDLSVSWDPVPNAERYNILVQRINADYQSGLESGIDTSFKYETTETHIDLTECFVPGVNEYVIWILAEADGYFDSEYCVETYKLTDTYLNERLPNCYIKNLSISSEGILTWDSYKDAKAYSIYLGRKSTLLRVDDLQKDSKGRYSCDLNYYCAALGCEASDLEIGVSAFSDHTDNRGYRISGITRTTYKYGGIKTLTGEVVYSGEARYGYTLGVSINGAPAGVMLDYEWQVHENGVWTKIASSSNSKNLTVSANLIGKYIRVSVTAKGGYMGTLNGAPKLVGKTVPYKPVPTPELTFNRITSGGNDVARITVLNYSSDFEYIITESAIKEWPSNAQKIQNGTVDVTLGSQNKVYYVYARYVETETREGGAQFAGGSVSIPAKSGNTTYAQDLIYPEYDTKTPTIYLQKGKTITIKYQLNPGNATENLPRWNASYDGLVSVSHKQAAKTITITANNVGTAFVVAYKPNENTPWYYGSDYSNMGRQIKVVVYDPNDPGKVPFTITKLPDVEIFVGDSYKVDISEISKLPFVPDTVDKNKYNYSAFVKTKDNMTGSPYVGEVAKDGSVTIKNAVVTANKVGEATVYVIARTDSKTPTNADYYFAYFTIKVSNKPENKVEKLTLSTKSVSFRVGDVFSIIATKDPIDAKETISWSTSNRNVVTVDSNGELKAVGKGVATITAKCGTITATCSVEVKPAYCTEHKDVEYTYVDQDTHKWVCKTCGVQGTEAHSADYWNSDANNHWRSCTIEGCYANIEKTKAAHDFKWVTDKEATATESGLKHEECKTCHYKKAAVEMSASDGDASTEPATSSDDASSATSDIVSDTETPDISGTSAEPSGDAPSDALSGTSSGGSSNTVTGGESSDGGSGVLIIAIIAVAVIIAAAVIIIITLKRKSK